MLLNSGAALLAANRVSDIPQGVEMAAEVIDTGAALAKLEALVTLSQQLGEELDGE